MWRLVQAEHMFFLTSIFWTAVNSRRTQFRPATGLPNERLAYMKRIISNTCAIQRASRLNEMHILKMTCRLVQVKRHIFWKSCVSFTPNAHFYNKHSNLLRRTTILKLAHPYWTCTNVDPRKECASRASRTPFFSPLQVSSCTLNS